MPHLKLFGTAVLEVEDDEVTGPAGRRHPLALLALLTTAPSRTLSRSKLAGLLWPESPEKAARNRLGTCVHRIRSRLGGDVLVSAGHDLRLDHDLLPTDVGRFEEAVEEGDFGTAVELYEGPFLDGFSLDGSPGFEKRVDRTRSRLRRDYLESLEALAEAAHGDDPETEARWWRERALEDPHDSRVTRRLMESLAAAGNRAEALRVAREHARVLEEEFGTEPGDGVRRLAHELRETGGEKEGDRQAAGPDAPGTDELPARSVAVLPFENLGGTEETDLFAAGLHDDLITELSKVSDLAVISRTSVTGYRDTDRPASDIAGELGVGTLVEGGVRQASGRMRLNVQLVDARRDVHLWGERYDRELTAENLFDLQAELAARIAEILRVKLSPGEQRRMGRAPTENLDAYRLCVQARGFVDQRTGESMRRAVDYFRRTLDRDPSYALAWSGLADALALLEFYGHDLPDDAPDAMEAARRAVELTPESGEAHTSLGILHSLRREGPDALRELGRARELAPSYAEPHAWLAWVQLLRGRPSAAGARMRRAVELNPFVPAFRSYLAEALLAQGEHEAARDEARRARELHPDFALAAFVEGLVLHHTGRRREAASALGEALSLTRPSGTPSRPEARAALAVARQASGEEDRARELLGRLEEDRDSPGAAFSIGLVRASLGDEDGAFRSFREVREWDDFAVDHARHFFPDVLGPMRETPRWRRLLRRIDRDWGWEGADV